MANRSARLCEAKRRQRALCMTTRGRVARGGGGSDNRHAGSITLFWGRFKKNGGVLVKIGPVFSAFKLERGVFQ